MKTAIFLGPTLSGAIALELIPSAIILPPVSQGDVFRATFRRPIAIVIIDGLFEAIPAVWHKEILWALDHGIHVFGCSSMGALRAVELAAFGMQGHGRIFEWYRDGRIEDDDEVAVVHAAEDMAYRPSSEAMVNIRYTLESARDAGVVAPANYTELIRVAKSLHYPDRSYLRVFELAIKEGMKQEEIAKLRQWLPRDSVGNSLGFNLKQEDAISMLSMIRDWLASDPRPVRVSFTFQHTIWWDHVEHYSGRVDARPSTDGASIDLTVETLMDELRLNPERFVVVHEGAMLRVLALQKASGLGYRPTPESLTDTALDFRTVRGLYQAEELDAWLAQNDLSLQDFSRLLADEALLERVRADAERNVIHRIPDFLRVNGSYQLIVDRIKRKEDILSKMGVDNPSLSETGITEQELLSWYFGNLERPVPDSMDQYASDLGFRTLDQFRRAILREFWFVRAVEQQDADSEPTAKF